MDTSNYAMVSTGDPAEDQRQLQQFALGSKRMAHGMCPNGCPIMLVEGELNTHECPQCKFVLHGICGEDLTRA
jgi:hypothetical protein